MIQEKAFFFAVRIINLSKYLQKHHCDNALRQQLLRSGTSIGANVSEAEQAQSKADFISKMSIALKETSETKYWLKLLIATNYLSENEGNSILSDCIEIEKMLTSIIKSSK